MDSKKVLLVDDDIEIGDLVETTLSIDGYEILRAEDGLAGLDKARSKRPNLIVMDIDMPRMDGLTLCSELRKDKDLHYVPIIMLTGSRTHPEDRITGLKMGADDYILKPFLPQELSIRVNRLISRTEEHLSVNPLTRLPGSYSLEKEVVSKIEKGEKFAVSYFDLDNFKAYNDFYGYQRGDDMIKYVASLINDVSLEFKSDCRFLVHIGGDDFILLSDSSDVENICDKVIKEFTLKVPSYYGEEERTKGYISTSNRNGDKQNFPLMTLSVAIASNDEKNITHYAQLIDILTEMKSYAKKQKGSVWIKDRRK